ncbi:SMP-30/gluconolactonase/LRE family protein [Tropicibacter sp. R15_0]|uniref:SMP-30/gluconolactonase/LRE family protein n=1 Tax=Tropicibacter sp. R15_0 TaxID=2821101 RepID=UPI00256FC646|nr:SMP-30/gluconolactonase/LRE family protein [Tropicibacter sp. R15_0]
MLRLWKYGLVFSAGLILLIAVYLALPARGVFEPSAFQPAELPPWEGPLEPNSLLQSADVIGLDQLQGPEELAVGPDGWFYTGTGDGFIKRFDLDGNVEIYAETGGRPAGVDFDTDGNLYVAVGYRGLMRVSPSGEVTLIADRIDGIDLNFVDGLRVGHDGMVYFTRASAKYTMHDWLYDFLESSPNGMLLRHDPETGNTDILSDNMYFPNGVVLSPDGDYLLINETSRFRIMRYWLEGPRAGSLDVFADNLPRLPDGLALDPSSNELYVALSSRRSDQIDGLISQPGFVRNAFLRIPPFLFGELQRYAIFVVMSPEGEIIRSYHDPDGPEADDALTIKLDHPMGARQVSLIQLKRTRATETAETNYSGSSQILGLGKTPAQWVEVMAGMGIDISERTLRERANETGAFYRLGRTMLITPAQIDTIFEGGQSFRSKFTRGAVSTGPRGGLNITVGQSPAPTGEAIRHLQKRSHGTG